MGERAVGLDVAGEALVRRVAEGRAPIRVPLDDAAGGGGHRSLVAHVARTGAPLACSRYVHLPRRASIGAKRQRAATELRDALAKSDPDHAGMYGEKLPEEFFRASSS